MSKLNTILAYKIPETLTIGSCELAQYGLESLSKRIFYPSSSLTMTALTIQGRRHG